MKRFFSIFVSFIIICMLAGCGNAKGDNINVSTVYSGISPMSDSTLVEMNDSYISNYYGIDVSELKEYVFAQSEDPKSAETIIMFKCEDNDKRKTYIEAVNNALKQKYEELSNYDLPEEAKLVKAAKVKTKGNFVYVIISDNASDMNKIVKDSIS